MVAGSVILLTLPNADDAEVEVGWHLHPDSWGRGYATEAATAVIQHGFDAGLPDVYAITHTTNERSQAVCRRLGLDDLGVLEKWYEGESRVYRTTPERWANRPRYAAFPGQPPTCTCGRRSASGSARRMISWVNGGMSPSPASRKRSTFCPGAFSLHSK